MRVRVGLATPLPLAPAPTPLKVAKPSVARSCARAEGHAANRRCSTSFEAFSLALRADAASAPFVEAKAGNAMSAASIMVRILRLDPVPMSVIPALDCPESQPRGVLLAIGPKSYADGPEA